jgi:hypothetical protein
MLAAVMDPEGRQDAEIGRLVRELLLTLERHPWSGTQRP